ncbi:hypothetical protein AVEN_104724-1 [Araneus ventricosus]|uniref:Uncharacterized protein n=1 Tax=Araneus ventricosus TaxID=182803 RepID=A0A4Y2W6U2_ARAVE|nr:hypothetical protein AVEN_104724-1 [Araneus ventricosus]
MAGYGRLRTQSVKVTGQLVCYKEENGIRFQMKLRKKSPWSKERPGSQYSSTIAQAVSHGLSLSWPTVRKICRSIVKWHSYKIHIGEPLNPADPDKHTHFARFLVTFITLEHFGVGRGAFYPRRSSEYSELSHTECCKS